MMPTSAEQRKHIRTILRVYLEKAEANQPDIHYSQHRPLLSLGKPPSSSSMVTDCSGLVISASYWADIWLPLSYKDPGGYHYSGWGNTGSILATNHKRRVPLDHKFFVGDMALYGSWNKTKHVTICRKNGDTQSSVWTSHGSERGPYACRLLYRNDLVAVFRAEQLA